uniref:Uncharacterized protein n=1 Tax=Lygus hesperus TaxID=30085 RepID=A0A146MHD7_LYGHE
MRFKKVEVALCKHLLWLFEQRATTYTVTTVASCDKDAPSDAPETLSSATPHEKTGRHYGCRFVVQYKVLQSHNSGEQIPSSIVGLLLILPRPHFVHFDECGCRLRIWAEVDR